MTSSKRIALATVTICLIASCVWADASDRSTTAERAVLPVKSEPILIPAPKPDSAAPSHMDIVTTPGASAGRLQRTSVPGISPSPVPDAITKPITVDQALQVAFENNPDIQAALSQVEASRGVVDEARARFNPTFSIQASTTFQGPAVTTQMGDQSMQMLVSPDKQASASVTLPLDISHQLRYSSDIARYQFQEQYLSMVAVSEQLIADVKSAYYDLLRACGQRAVAQSAVDSAKSRLENIRAKREEGTVPQFDVTTAEVELDNLHQQLIIAQNSVSIAQSALNEVLGVDVSNPTQVVAVDVPITMDCIDIPKSIEQAYAKRPELKASQMAVTLSETNVRLQKTGALPSLALSGGSSYDFNPSGFSSNNYSWTAGAILSVPVWDGGVTKAKVRQARADVQNSVAGLDRSKITVARQVRNAALNLQEAALRTQTTAHAVTLAEDALGIATDRYDAGIAVLVEVTNAQTQLTQARFNYVDAQYDYAVALAQLQRATSCQPELNQLQLLADQGNVTQNDNEARS